MNSVFLWTPNNLIHRGKQRRPARACWTKLKSQSSQSSVALKKRLFVSGEFLLLVSSRAASTHVHQERPVTVTHRGIVGKQGGARHYVLDAAVTPGPQIRTKRCVKTLMHDPLGSRPEDSSDGSLTGLSTRLITSGYKHWHNMNTCGPLVIQPIWSHRGSKNYKTFLHPWRHWNTSG